MNNVFFKLKVNPLQRVGPLSYTSSSDEIYEVLYKTAENQKFLNKIQLEPLLHGFPRKNMYRQDLKSLIQQNKIECYEQQNYITSFNVDSVVYMYFNKSQSLYERIFNCQSIPKKLISKIEFIGDFIVITPYNKSYKNYVLTYREFKNLIVTKEAELFNKVEDTGEIRENL